MRLRIAAASLTLASALGIGALSAQGQNPPAPVPAQPGQPTQPGQPQPGQPTQPQPTQPGQPRPGQPTQPGQGTTPTQPGSTQPGSSTRTQAGTEREVTITGCLTRDTSKPAAGGQATDGFLLTHARMAAAGDARGSASGAQTTQTPAGAGAMGQQYRLMAKGDVNFTPHLNHQVRVTGMAMDNAAANRPNTPGAGSTPGGSTGANSATRGSATAPAPMFHVTQLTMVSATCETK